MANPCESVCPPEDWRGTPALTTSSLAPPDCPTDVTNPGGSPGTITAGCGLNLVGNVIKLNLTDVALDGLIWDNTGCTLSVDFACGLTIVGNSLAVDYDNLAGPRATTSLVRVSDTPCDHIGVDLTPNSTSTETADKLTGFELTCDKYLKIKYDRATYTNYFNQAGLLIDRTAGIPTHESLDIPLCQYIECCSADTLDADATGDPLFGPSPLDVDFAVTPSGGIGPFTYAWQINDIPFTTDQNPSHVFTDPGAYKITVTVTDTTCNCSVTKTFFVYVTVDTCACTDCPTGVPDRWTVTLTGGTNDFVPANGSWTLYHVSECGWAGDLNGWRANWFPTSTPSTFEVFDVTDPTGKIAQYEGTTECCDTVSDEVEVSHVGTGTRPTVGPIGPEDACGPCSVPTSCCGPTKVSSLFYLHISDCSGLGSIPLTYDAGGAHGAGWYSAVIPCAGGHVMQYYWLCDNSGAGPNWVLKQFCDTGSGTGGGGAQVSCSPFSYTGGVAAFSGTCSAIGPTFTVNETP